MKAQRTLIFLLFSTLSLSVVAHVEDKPGPHGGSIQMPEHKGH